MTFKPGDAVCYECRREMADLPIDGLCVECRHQLIVDKMEHDAANEIEALNGADKPED